MFINRLQNAADLHDTIKMAETRHRAQHDTNKYTFFWKLMLEQRKYCLIIEQTSVRTNSQRGRFATQVDEGTDVSNVPQLMAFARFCFNNEI